MFLQIRKFWGEDVLPDSVEVSLIASLRPWVSKVEGEEPSTALYVYSTKTVRGRVVPDTSIPPKRFRIAEDFESLLSRVNELRSIMYAPPVNNDQTINP